jgi:hypothetical protein
MERPTHPIRPRCPKTGEPCGHVKGIISPFPVKSRCFPPTDELASMFLPNFEVVYAGQGQPPQDVQGEGTWEAEAAMDIELAHAMAPNTKVYLVEAQSDYIDDLTQAEQFAAQIVANAGGGVVSNSFGGTSLFRVRRVIQRHITTSFLLALTSHSLCRRETTHLRWSTPRSRQM